MLDGCAWLFYESEEESLGDNQTERMEWIRENVQQ